MNFNVEIYGETPNWRCGPFVIDDSNKYMLQSFIGLERERYRNLFDIDRTVLCVQNDADTARVGSAGTRVRAGSRRSSPVARRAAGLVSPPLYLDLFYFTAVDLRARCGFNYLFYSRVISVYLATLMRLASSRHPTSLRVALDTFTWFYCRD